MLPYASIEAACGSVSFPRFAGEGRDGGQRADEVVCPPPRSSEVRGRLPPTSILPHTWGRKMLPYASIEAACGSVSFPRFTGEGRDGGQRADEVVCPPPQSSEVRGRLSPTSILLSARLFVPHLGPPPYMGEEDAALCQHFTCMWQRLLPLLRGGRPGWGTARSELSAYLHHQFVGFTTNCPAVPRSANSSVWL